MRAMQNLHDYNKMMRKYYEGMTSVVPHPNGIGCPKCGAELYDSEPGRRIASNPPKTRVHCGACGYRGYRLA